MKNVIKVQKIESAVHNEKENDLFSMACLAAHYYPSQDPNYYMGIPIKRLATMIKVAQKVEVVRLSNLLDIILVPHSEKPNSAADKLYGRFQEVLNG